MDSQKIRCNVMLEFYRDIAPLPKLTDEGLRVTVFRVREGYPENSADISATVRAILLISDARMHDETLLAGDAFIWEVRFTVCITVVSLIEFYFGIS